MTQKDATININITLKLMFYLSPKKRQRGRGVFQQRANIETALNFLKRKSVSFNRTKTPTDKQSTASVSTVCIINICHIWFLQIKLVNINISDVIDGRPSIILGLIWTIILHCHVSTDAKLVLAHNTHLYLCQREEETTATASCNT